MQICLSFGMFSCVYILNFKSLRCFALNQDAAAALVQSQESQRCMHLWTKLHLSILQTILQFPSIPGAPQLELITLADMMMIVKDIALIAQLLAGVPNTTDATETAVDRLVQVLQVALATGAFRCSIGR